MPVLLSVWSRWVGYAQSGHGGNKQLRALVGRDLTYPRANFRYTLLEFFPFGTPDAVVIGREGFWKDVLLTRGGKVRSQQQLIFLTDSGRTVWDAWSWRAAG